MTGIDEHASVHALDGDEVFSSELVLVNVAELNLSERGSTSGIVDNILDDSLNVAKTRKHPKVNIENGLLTLVSQRNRGF